MDAWILHKSTAQTAYKAMEKLVGLLHLPLARFLNNLCQLERPKGKFIHFHVPVLSY